MDQLINPKRVTYASDRECNLCSTESLLLFSKICPAKQEFRLASTLNN
jgi:hypothetical protein